MSLLSWFWLTMIVSLTVGCVLQIRGLLAVSAEWTITATDISKPMEGHHAADPENR
jgi:hypothetical protein